MKNYEIVLFWVIRFVCFSESTLEFPKDDIINLDGHSQYGDMEMETPPNFPITPNWNPQKPILMPASSDQMFNLWNGQDVSKYFQEIGFPGYSRDIPGGDGKMFAIGTHLHLHN